MKISRRVIRISRRVIENRTDVIFKKNRGVSDSFFSDTPLWKIEIGYSTISISFNR